MHEPIGADAVLPARRSRLRRPASAIRVFCARLAASGRLSTGSGVWMARRARIDVAPGARVLLGDGVELGDGARIDALNGTVTVGDRTRIGDRAALVGTTRVEVGPDALLGDWSFVGDADTGLGPPAPVRIGAGARLGAHATVGPGVQLADGAVVGSYALVRAPRSPA
jgi:acetyltransferase-like isoleucine patch superfamily enzyme